MSFNRLYFPNQIDEERFFNSQKNLLAGKKEQIHADVGRAMESFSKIETGLATLIARALKPDTSIIDRPDFKKAISQYFGMHHMIRMVKALIKMQVIEYEGGATVLRPGTPSENVGIIEAIEFVSKYRNALVHNGVHTGIRFENDVCIADAIILAEGEDYVPILSSGDGFGIFLGRLAMVLPPAINPVFNVLDQEIDIKKFLTERSEKWNTSQQKYLSRNAAKMSELANLF